jgi:hypothetical protein
MRRPGLDLAVDQFGGFALAASEEPLIEAVLS